MMVDQNLLPWAEGFHSVSLEAFSFLREVVVNTLLLDVTHGLINCIVPKTFLVIIQTIFVTAFRSPSHYVGNNSLGDEDWNTHDA